MTKPRTPRPKVSGRNVTPRWKLALSPEARKLMALAAERAGDDIATFARIAIAESCARELGLDPASVVAEFEPQ